MRNRSIITMLILFAALACGESVLAAKTNSTTVTLTVPRRRRVVKLARDLACLRDMDVVCFQGKVDAEDPAMHVFRSDKWERIDTKAYSAMLSSTLVLIGDSKTVPAVLLNEKLQPSTTWRIETLDVATIVTNLADKLELTSREVKWLAKRHGLKISETKAPRPKYGRPAGSKKKTKVKKVRKTQKVDDTLPPPGSYPTKPTLEEIDGEAVFEKGMTDVDPATFEDEKTEAPVEEDVSLKVE